MWNYFRNYILFHKISGIAASGFFRCDCLFCCKWFSCNLQPVSGLFQCKRSLQVFFFVANVRCKRRSCKWFCCNWGGVRTNWVAANGFPASAQTACHFKMAFQKDHKKIFHRRETSRLYHSTVLNVPEVGPAKRLKLNGTSYIINNYYTSDQGYSVTFWPSNACRLLNKFSVSWTWSESEPSLDLNLSC